MGSSPDPMRLDRQYEDALCPDVGERGLPASRKALDAVALQSLREPGVVDAFMPEFLEHRIGVAAVWLA